MLEECATTQLVDQNRGRFLTPGPEVVPSIPHCPSRYTDGSRNFFVPWWVDLEVERESVVRKEQDEGQQHCCMSVCLDQRPQRGSCASAAHASAMPRKNRWAFTDTSVGHPGIWPDQSPWNRTLLGPKQQADQRASSVLLEEYAGFPGKGEGRGKGKAILKGGLN